LKVETTPAIGHQLEQYDTNQYSRNYMNNQLNNSKHAAPFPPENTNIRLRTAKENLPVPPANMDGKRFLHEA